MAVITLITLLPWILSLDYTFDADVFQVRLDNETGGIQTVREAKRIAAYYNVLTLSAILLAALVEMIVHTPIDAWWWGTGAFAAGAVIIGDRFWFKEFENSPILWVASSLAGDIEPRQIPITANLFQYANERWDSGL